MRTKVRAAEQIFENGDTVFYKREGKDRWLGPANVVFQDGKVVFIRHGGIFVRVSPNRLTKTYDSQIKTEVEGLDGNSSDQHNEADKIKMSSNTVTSVSETVPTPPDNPEAIRDQDERIERGRINPRHVKAYDIIKYKVNDEWETGTIISRAGKSTGKYKTWYNIRDGNNKERSVDLSVVEWEKIPDTEMNITCASDKVESEEKDITMAKKNELDKLAQFNTYEEVAEQGQRTLSTRWVITSKEGKPKARLVVRGFEEKDLEIPRDSPTVGKGAMRIFLSIAGLEQWTVKTTDIKSAFLQGKELDREIFVKPPKESGTPKPKIWKLKHGLYGLKDGARQFYYRQMLEDILGYEHKTIRIEAYVDNKSVIEALFSTRMVEDKRLRVDVVAIQESLKLQDINLIQWIPGQLQLANVMTKQGASGFLLLKVLQSGNMLADIYNH